MLYTTNKTHTNNVQITDPRCNGTGLTLITVNNTPVFRKGAVNVSFAISTNYTELNSDAARIYLRLRNSRTGQTIEVGKAVGTRTGSLPAIDGDLIEIYLYGLGDGYLDSNNNNYEIYGDGSNQFTYPFAEAISIVASVQYRGYRGENGHVVPYDSQWGTLTITPSIRINHPE